MKTLLAVCLTIAACKEAPERVELGAVAQPFGLLAPLKVGMTFDEVKKLVPQLQGRPQKPEERGASLSAHADKASYTVMFLDGKVSELDLHLIGRPPADVVKAWGPGKDWGDHAHHYFDTAAHLRADVSDLSEDSFAIRSYGYTPLAELLGKDPSSVGGFKILGRPAKELATEMQSKGVHVVVPKGLDDPYETFFFDMPLTEWGYSTSSGIAFSDKGPTVVAWSLDPVAGLYGDAIKPDVLAVYEQAWGKPTRETESELVYGKDPEVHVSRKDLTMMIRGAAKPSP